MSSAIGEKDKQYEKLFLHSSLLYLKEYYRITYTNLLTSGRLNACIAKIGEQAKDMFFRLVKE